MAFDSCSSDDYVENESYVGIVVKLFDKAFINERINFEDGEHATSLAELTEKIYPFGGFSFSHTIVDPDVANVIIYGVKFSFGVSAEGEAGADFSYKCGVLAEAESASAGLENLSPEGGIGF